MFGEVVDLVFVYFVEVEGDVIGIGFGDYVVIGDYYYVGGVGFFDGVVEGCGRSGIDYDGFVVLQDQVLDLLGLFGGLVFGGSESGGGGYQFVFDGIVGGCGLGFEYGLMLGIGSVVVGQGDFGL